MVCNPTLLREFIARLQTSTSYLIPHTCIPQLSGLPSHPMSKYSHDTIVPYQNSDQSKKEQVAGMFDQIAFRYDFLNRFLSGGIDIYWRKQAIKELKDLQPKLILDVATGTGDVAIMSWKYLRPEKIIGIDISEGMLEFREAKNCQVVVK